jgi:8-oxo-dGTP pyrophosphatase MutT (NUDIX family)
VAADLANPLDAGPTVLDVMDPVLAAGGVVLRDGPGGREVVLVHRPRYGDWTLPKGKREADETDRQTALREVEEETGLRCELLTELRSISYVDARGRPKIVRYWAMRAPDEGSFEPTPEVDEVRWVTISEADALLSYERDREVLRSVEPR